MLFPETAKFLSNFFVWKGKRKGKLAVRLRQSRSIQDWQEGKGAAAKPQHTGLTRRERGCGKTAAYRTMPQDYSTGDDMSPLVEGEEEEERCSNSRRNSSFSE